MYHKPSTVTSNYNTYTDAYRNEDNIKSYKNNNSTLLIWQSFQCSNHIKVLILLS